MEAKRERNNKELRISGARLIFKNFSGKPDKYTRDVRKFHLCLPVDLARELKEDGWNIKFPKDPESDLLPHVEVIVSYRKIPPLVVQITSKHKTNLSEEEVGSLDWMEFENVDIVVSGSHWSREDGSWGIKAYLKSIYVTVKEDEFEAKYRYLDEDEEEEV